MSAERERRIRTLLEQRRAAGNSSSNSGSSSGSADSSTGSGSGSSGNSAGSKQARIQQLLQQRRMAKNGGWVPARVCRRACLRVGSFQTGMGTALGQLATMGSACKLRAVGGSMPCLQRMAHTQLVGRSVCVDRRWLQSRRVPPPLGMQPYWPPVVA